MYILRSRNRLCNVMKDAVSVDIGVERTKLEEGVSVCKRDGARELDVNVNVDIVVTL